MFEKIQMKKTIQTLDKILIMKFSTVNIIMSFQLFQKYLKT